MSIKQDAHMIKEAIRKIVDGVHLTESEAAEIMDEIMSGIATDAQIGSFITALRMKGETVDELTGLVKVMRDKATKINCPHPVFMDTCGTGGDMRNTFNISTVAAFVVAGAGIPVAKHGNRAVSSRCGSADLLLALGVNIEAEVPVVEKCLAEIGIGFLFAPLLHRAMKYAIGPRREIGIRTVFNILGPLTNPAGARYQVLGVFAPQWTEPVAHVLKNLGTERAFVVHGLDGLDEFSTIGVTRVSELKKGTVSTREMTPEEFGIKRVAAQDIAGGDVEENAVIARGILSGETGPRRDIVLLNAAASIMVAGKARTIGDGLKIAAESIDSGEAHERLKKLAGLSHGKN